MRGYEPVMPLLYPVLSDDLRQLPLYVTTIGSQYVQDTMSRRHGYPDWHWLQCVSGAGLFQTPVASVLMTPGTGVMLAPGTPHRYRPAGIGGFGAGADSERLLSAEGVRRDPAEDGPWASEALWRMASEPAPQEEWITTFVTYDGFSAAAITSTDETGMLVRRFRKPGSANVCEQRIQEMLDSLAGTRPDRQESTSVQLYAFLLQLRQSGSAPEMQGKGESGFRKAFAWLEEHFGDDITLDDLALQAGVSRQHLCRLFRAHLGMRPFDYLTRFRVQRAKELLVRDWKAGNEEIASRCGFRDGGYFIRRFRAVEGVTPGEFRTQHGMIDR